MRLYSALKSASGGRRMIDLRTVALEKNHRPVRAGCRCDGEVVRPKEPNWTAWANEIA